MNASLRVSAAAGVTVVADADYTTRTAYAPGGFAVQIALPGNPTFTGPAVCKLSLSVAADATAFSFVAAPRAIWTCLATTLRFKCGGTVLVRAATPASGDFAASDFSAALEVAPACATGARVGAACHKR